MIDKKIKAYQALVLRFVITRYGRENLGFLWVVVEPMILCVGVMAVWSLTKGRTDHGLQVTAIVYSGYMALTLWRHMTNSMIYIIRTGRFLTNFRSITQLDVVLSRLLLEFISVTAAAIIVYSVLYIFGLMPPVYDLGLVMIGWLTMGALALGAGLLLVGFTETSEIAERFVQPFQYLMIPFSGCFFFLEWLPDEARRKIEYVPFVHSFEAIRGGIFGPEVQTYSDPLYAFRIALLMCGLGFALVKFAEDRIQP